MGLRNWFSDCHAHDNSVVLPAHPLDDWRESGSFRTGRQKREKTTKVSAHRKLKKRVENSKKERKEERKEGEKEIKRKIVGSRRQAGGSTLEILGNIRALRDVCVI